MNKQAREYIELLLKDKTRLDGRKLDEYRKPLTIELGISKSAEGSARVKIGKTEVLAGIKMAVGVPYPDTPNEGCLVVGAELLPLSNPEFEPGPPSIQAIELARVVDRGIRESHAIDFKKLCIREGELVWIVNIDICTVNDAGNLFDASALATLAALKETKLPKLEGDKINYKELSNTKLPLTRLPVSVTVSKIGNNFIVDPVTDEEEVIDARLSAASLEDGTLCAMQKGGEVPLTDKDVDVMVSLSLKKAKELRKQLE